MTARAPAAIFVYISVGVNPVDTCTYKHISVCTKRWMDGWMRGGREKERQKEKKKETKRQGAREKERERERKRGRASE